MGCQPTEFSFTRRCHFLMLRGLAAPDTGFFNSLLKDRAPLLPDLRLDRGGDLVGLRADVVFIAAFNEQTDQ